VTKVRVLRAGTAVATTRVRILRAGVTSEVPNRIRILRAGVSVSVTLTANAGADQTVDSLALVTLTAAASSGSPDGWEWTQVAGPTVTLSSSSVMEPTFIAPATEAGVNLTFQLRVKFGATFSAAVTVTIHTRPHILWSWDGADWQPMTLELL
jgi:hypothetical protein